jgi:Major Facilitator Superfamily
LFGKFYSFFSIKWTYLIAIGVFELGSLICATAPTSNAFIVGRAIAGLGCSGLFSGALIIIAHSVPLRQRPLYTGLIGSMYGIASVAGPLMGGAFTDKLTWRWCFYINLPIGAVTIIVIMLFFKSPTIKKDAAVGFWKRLEQFDLWGTLVFIPAIVCLLLALQWGGSKYAWKDGRIIACLVLFVVLSVAFVWIQHWRQENATVPPRIFCQRSILAAAFFGFCVGSAFLLLVYYLPLWFQAVKGATAIKSGIMNLPMILALVIFSIIAGGLVTALGYYSPFMIASSILMAIGAGLITTFESNTGHAKWIGYQCLFGFGCGLGMQQSLIVAQTVLPIADVPIGVSIMIFAQTLGGALFISIGQNIFTNKLISGLASRVPDLDPKVVINTGATSLKTIPELVKYFPEVIASYNDALVGAYEVSLAMACISILGSAFVEWKSVKGKKIEMAA